MLNLSQNKLARVIPMTLNSSNLPSLSDSNRILDMSEGAYHEHPAISQSGLKEVMKSPAHFQAWLRRDKEMTQAQVVGRATHMAILEPEKFYRDFVQRPEDLDMRTKEGKAFASENAGKSILSFHDYRMCVRMMESVYSHPAASGLLTNGKPEQSIFWKDLELGVECKARVDYLKNDGCIVDVKTTVDASTREFERTIAAYGYHIQAAFYADALRAVKGTSGPVFQIVVEKEDPYAVNVFQVDEQAIQIGRREYDAALKLYAQCLKSDVWPCYPTEIQTIGLPLWKLKEFANVGFGGAQ